MSVQPVSRRPQLGIGASEAPLLWVVLAVGSGLVVGGASSFSLPGAIALATAIALLVWVIPRPGILLIALIASVFVQVIAVGGVTIGRICAPIAASSSGNTATGARQPPSQRRLRPL